ncbi:MAG: trypsin-like peptidase domain-containing protein [Actinomycetota bacterium]
MVVGLVIVARSLDRQARELDEIQAATEELRRTGQQTNEALGGVAGRIDDVERELTSTLEPSEIARQALESVYTIRVSGGSGSAWVAESGGTSTLVTNYHVVESAYTRGVRTVSVRQDDRTFTGEIGDVSQTEDLAAVAVRARLDALPIQRSGTDPGDTVLAIGSPVGLEGTVTTGVVSATRNRGIQFTAPVNPGSSGGPLLDAEGAVVGVVSAKFVGVGIEGLSFAIPMESVCATVLRC